MTEKEKLVEAIVTRLNLSNESADALFKLKIPVLKELLSKVSLNEKSCNF